MAETTDAASALPAGPPLRPTGRPQLALPSPHPGRRRTAWIAAWTWVLPALATLGIVGYHLDRRQLWRDEIATWSASTRSVPDLWHLLHNIDGVLGGYYLFMHFWIVLFGDSTAVLRAPSVLAMAASAALVALLGRQLFGDWAGFSAGLVFALLPATSRYGQEARPYAFATLFAVGSALLLIHALDRPTWTRAAAYAVCVLALGLLQLTALLLVAGHGFALLARWRQGGSRFAPRWCGGVAVVAVLLLPLALLGRAQQRAQVGWLATPTWVSLRELPESLVLSAVVGGLVLGLAIVGSGGRDRWAAVLAAQVALPVGLLYIGGLLTPLFWPRYLTFTLPFVCVLAGIAIASLRLPVAVIAVLLVGVLGWSDQSRARSDHVSLGGATIDYAGAANVLRHDALPGDGIVFSPRRHSSMLDLAMAYHLRGALPTDVLVAQDSTRAGSFWARECAQPRACLSHVRRVWLLTNGNHDDPLRTMEAAKAAAITTDFTIVTVRVVNGITIGLATRR